MTQTSTAYRFDIRYPANRGGSGRRFRLMITADDGSIVSAVFYTAKPTMAFLREHLASKGFEAYGDILNMSGGTFRTMVRPIT